MLFVSCIIICYVHHCSYNNKTYRVDAIEWDMNLESKFTKTDGTCLTYKDYYESTYDVPALDKLQPLIVCIIVCIIMIVVDVL